MAEAFGQGVPVALIPDHPFSADEVITQMPSPHVRNVVPRETIRVYRDSAGRTRTDVSVPPNPIETPFVTIFDTVAGMSYALDTEKKVARRFIHSTPAPGQTSQTTAAAVAGGWITPGNLGDFATHSESLGTQLIEGLVADGRRITSTSPQTSRGDAQENINESWYSQELKMTLLMQAYNSILGSRTTRLENINRAEPDPTLFQVPPDYTIVDAPVNGTAKPK
jgi:hypothetical protein